MQLTFSDVEEYTLKEFVIMYDAWLLETWNHTACICAQLYNIQTVLINCNSKANLKPKGPTEFHPYLEKPKKEGIGINPDNIGTLLEVVEASM